MTKILIFIGVLGLCLQPTLLAGGISAKEPDFKLEKYFKTPSSIEAAKLVCYGKSEEFSNFLRLYPLNTLDKNDSMPLVLLSSKCDSQDIFDILEKNGAKLDRALPNGMHLIHYFSELQNKYYLQKAIGAGVSVNTVNERKKWKPTPIFYAISAAKLDNLSLLIAEGAEINYQNSGGNTPAIYATNSNYYEAVYLLIKAGAEVQIKNNFGKTLLDKIEGTGIDPSSESAVWKEKVIREIQGLKTTS